MRNVLVNILLCCVLSLCGGGFASARTDGYDKALDKYAYICDRCVEMRDRARRGQRVSEESLRNMLEELAALRKTLSGVSGRMTAAQLARFEEIKARYGQGMGVSGSDPDVRPARRDLVPLPKIAAIPLPVTALRQAQRPGGMSVIEDTSPALRQAQRPGEMSVIEGTSPALRQAQRPGGMPVLEGTSPALRRAQRPGEMPRPDGLPQSESRQSLLAVAEPVEATAVNPSVRTSSHNLEIYVLAEAGIFPTPSYGAAAMLTWNGVGVYAGFRSNFRKNDYSYTCFSDGSTEYGRIWATGKVRQSRSVATAGFAMRLSRHLGFRLGAGLTSYTRCWEDVSGQWAKVEDKSFCGFAADGGIFLTFKPVVFSVGVTPDFSGHADLQFGVGVRF